MSKPTDSLLKQGEQVFDPILPEVETGDTSPREPKAKTVRIETPSIASPLGEKEDQLNPATSPKAADLESEEERKKREKKKDPLDKAVDAIIGLVTAVIKVVSAVLEAVAAAFSAVAGLFGAVSGKGQSRKDQDKSPSKAAQKKELAKQTGDQALAAEAEKEEEEEKNSVESGLNALNDPADFAEYSKKNPIMGALLSALFGKGEEEGKDKSTDTGLIADLFSRLFGDTDEDLGVDAEASGPQKIDALMAKISEKLSTDPEAQKKAEEMGFGDLGVDLQVAREADARERGTEAELPVFGPQTREEADKSMAEELQKQFDGEEAQIESDGKMAAAMKEAMDSGVMEELSGAGVEGVEGAKVSGPATQAQFKESQQNSKGSARS